MRKFLFNPDTLHAIAFILGLITMGIAFKHTDMLFAILISSSIGCSYLAAFCKGYLEGLQDGSKKAYKSITQILDNAIKDKQS